MTMSSPLADTAKVRDTHLKSQLGKLFHEIYSDVSALPEEKYLLRDANDKLDSFIAEVKAVKKVIDNGAGDAGDNDDHYLYLREDKRTPQWYQNATMYCLYVDLFNVNLQGLIDRLDYLQQLGVTLLWILPILDSPMKDGGFDVSNFNVIRRDLHKPNVHIDAHREQGDVSPNGVTGVNGDGEEMSASPSSTSAAAVNGREKEETDPHGIAAFREFVKEAHKRGVSVLMDIALNHTSDQHEWFQSALQNDEKYRDFYIWSNTGKEFAETRVLFEGICDSIWNQVQDDRSAMKGKFYLHRFLREQPDLNYHNPEVLFAIARVFMFWQQNGVDAVRADAIPFLWKKEGTTCESLEQVHLILKFLRAVMEYLRPGTMILAEACQRPHDVVKYFGEEDEFGSTDECQAAYHFPLMPQLFSSFAMESNTPVIQILDESVTPTIPLSCQWFLFLRCHDELTLEMVPKKDQEMIFKHYCRDPQWNFRGGQGVAARLADLLNYNTRHIQLAHSILCTIVGTPILYYGDEFGMKNDDDYFEEILSKNKIRDVRNFNRGRVKWDHILRALNDRESQESQIFLDLQLKLKIREQILLPWIGNATVQMVSIFEQGENEKPTESTLAYKRISRADAENKDSVFCIHNLSSTKTIHVRLPDEVVVLSPAKELHQPSNDTRQVDVPAVFDLLGKKLRATIAPTEGSGNEQTNLHASVEMAPFDHFWFRLDDRGRLMLYSSSLWEVEGTK